MRPYPQSLVAQALANPLLLDFVLCVNSAAPAIYAKAMRDFLTAHQGALVKGDATHPYALTFVSLTSSADAATRYAHPFANLLCWFYPSLRRKFTRLIKIQTAGSIEITSHARLTRVGFTAVLPGISRCWWTTGYRSANYVMNKSIHKRS